VGIIFLRGASKRGKRRLGKIAEKIKLFNEAFGRAWDSLPEETRRAANASSRLRDFIQSALKAGASDAAAIAKDAEECFRAK
jgi:hypothetical protein